MITIEKEVAGYPTARMTTENYRNTLWTVDRIRFRNEVEVVFNEEGFPRFYGYGDVKKNSDEKDQKIAYSYEDIKTLYVKEMEVVTKLLNIIQEKELDDMLEKYDTSVEIVKEMDVNHPVDMFNLLRRMSITWKLIQEKTSDKRVKKLLGRFEVFVILSFLDSSCN